MDTASGMDACPAPLPADESEALNFGVAYLGGVSVPRALVELIAEKNRLRRLTQKCRSSDISPVGTPVSAVKKSSRGFFSSRNGVLAGWLKLLQSEVTETRFYVPHRTDEDESQSHSEDRQIVNVTVPAKVALSEYRELLPGGKDLSKKSTSVFQKKRFTRKEMRDIFGERANLSVRAQGWLKSNSSTGRPAKGLKPEIVPLTGLEVKHNRTKQVRNAPRNLVTLGGSVRTFQWSSIDVLERLLTRYYFLSSILHFFPQTLILGFEVLKPSLSLR